MTLKPGPNDISGLAPGVYFVASDGAPKTVRADKVMITH